MRWWPGGWLGFFLSNVEYSLNPVVTHCNFFPSVPPLASLLPPPPPLACHRDMFEAWCEDARNAVIVCDFAVSGTLAREILGGPKTISSKTGAKVRGGGIRASPGCPSIDPRSAQNLSSRETRTKLGRGEVRRLGCRLALQQTLGASLAGPPSAPSLPSCDGPPPPLL